MAAAAAKSRQSWPTLCDPIDGSPPGSRPWDSPGTNTGVGCHFLLQCTKLKSEREVAQLCPTLCDPMDCSLPGSSVHGILQARALEWGAIAFSASSWQSRANVNRKEHTSTTSSSSIVALYCPLLANSGKAADRASPALFSSVQSLSCVRLFATPWTAARQASLSIANFRSLLKLMSIASVMPSNHLILCPPFLLLSSIFPNIRDFSNKLVLHVRWLKYWSFSFSISPSNEYSGLISFRIDWLDLLAVQGTLKSLLQHHSSKASILWCSTFIIVQLSCPYMTTGKTIALTRQTFVGKVMSLLFNILSRLVIASLPGSRCLLISWLQSPSVVILQPPK